MGKVYKVGSSFLNAPSGIVSVKGVNKSYSPDNFYLFQGYVSLTSQPGKVNSASLSRKGKLKTQWKYRASTVGGDVGTFYWALTGRYDTNLGRIPIISTGEVSLSSGGEPAVGSITKTKDDSFILAIVPAGFYCLLPSAGPAGETLVEIGWTDPLKTDPFTKGVLYVEVASGRFLGIKEL